MRKKLTIIAIIVILLAAAGLYDKELSSTHSTVQSRVTPAVKQITSLSYKGENGKDSLTLLKQHANVQQDHSGLVVAIDDNKPAGHTYWAFYINGKLATVGPAEYVTKNSDVIEWKVEKY